MVTGGPPVEGGSDAEESGGGQVLQDGDERLELLPQTSPSRGAGQAHRERLVGLGLSVQDGKDLQGLQTEPDRTRQNQMEPDRTRWNQTEPDRTRQNQNEPDRTRWNQTKQATL